MICFRLSRITALVALLPISAALAEPQANPGATMQTSAPTARGVGSIGVPRGENDDRKPSSRILTANAAPQDTTACSSAQDNNTVAGTGAGNALAYPIGTGTGTGADNSLFGFEAGYYITNGSYNDFHGASAGYNTDTDADGNCGGYNVFIGEEAGKGNTSGTNNIYIGYRSGYLGSGYLISGNVAIGVQAGYTLSGGNCEATDPPPLTACYSENNVYIGYQTAYHSWASDDVFVGFQSGYANTYGDFNLFLGYESGFVNTTGNDNNFVGFQAGASNVMGSANNFYGYQAGYENTGSDNDFYGYQSGYSTTGTGSENDFFGYQAGFSNTTSTDNAYFGYQAGYMLTGSDNAVFGTQAGYGSASDTASQDAIFGAFAGKIDKGGYNSFVGYFAGYGNTTGDYNVAVGWTAGESNVSGSKLTFLGAETTASGTGYDNSVAVGFGAEITASNQVVLGNTSVASVTTSGTVNSNGALLNGSTVYSSQAPTLTSGDGLGMSPHVLLSNGTAAFELQADTTGMGTMSATVTLNLPTAADGWVCPVLEDITPMTPLTGVQSGTGTTTVTYTFPSTPSFSDKFIGGCTGSY